MFKCLFKDGLIYQKMWCYYFLLNSMDYKLNSTVPQGKVSYRWMDYLGGKYRGSRFFM